MDSPHNTIFLVDDSYPDNYYHEIIIKEAGIAKKVFSFQKARKALGFIEAQAGNWEMFPILLFLDINMPGMDGWEFLDALAEIDEAKRKKITVYMLSTSKNPADIIKSKNIPEVAGFLTKPLTTEALNKIMENDLGDMEHMTMVDMNSGKP